jgi:dihydroorotase
MIDPKAKWTLDATGFKSKSRNNPFHGTEVVGKAVATLVGGAVKMNLVG